MIGEAPASRGAAVRAALSGVVAAALALAVATLVASVMDPAAAPLLALGAAFVDVVPQPLVRGVIALFGTADKAALFVCMGVVALAAAVVAGLASLRDRLYGVAVVVVLGVVTVIAVYTRETTGGRLAAIPTLVGFGAGLLVLSPLVDAAARRRGAAAKRTGLSRRSFVTLAGQTAALTVLAAAGSAAITFGGRAVTSARAAVRLPRPAEPAPPLPAGVALDVPGITPFTTANDGFYRIDTALRIPQIEPASWSLRVHGLVDREVTLTWDELLASALVERDITLSCVSNEVGGTLVGNARWLGLPIADLLARAGVRGAADMVLSTSSDNFTAGTPLEALSDAGRGALLAIGMNGEPLPLRHGFPVRMVVPGLYGYVSATKWVVDLEVTRFADASAYWTRRGWSSRGPIKTQSRIDVPRGGAAAGKVAVAGVAWAQTRGISAVEVRIDGGAWVPAELAASANASTWRQWAYAWDATPGKHTLTVRATDGTGHTQTSRVARVVPNGASGWDSVTVRVT